MFLLFLVQSVGYLETVVCRFCFYCTYTIGTRDSWSYDGFYCKPLLKTSFLPIEALQGVEYKFYCVPCCCRLHGIVTMMYQSITVVTFLFSV